MTENKGQDVQIEEKKNDALESQDMPSIYFNSIQGRNLNHGATKDPSTHNIEMIEMVDKYESKIKSQEKTVYQFEADKKRDEIRFKKQVEASDRFQNLANERLITLEKSQDLLNSANKIARFKENQLKQYIEKIKNYESKFEMLITISALPSRDTLIPPVKKQFKLNDPSKAE